MHQGNESEVTAERKDSKVFSGIDQEYFNSVMEDVQLTEAPLFNFVPVQQYNAPPRSQECISVRRTEEGLKEKSCPHV